MDGPTDKFDRAALIARRIRIAHKADFGEGSWTSGNHDLEFGGVIGADMEIGAGAADSFKARSAVCRANQDAGVIVIALNQSGG